MMVAERGKSGGRKKKKSAYVRVGTGYADEQKLRAKVRGNTGDGSPGTGDGDGRMLPLRNPETGREYRYLPSEALVDLHIREIDDVDADGEAINVRFFDRSIRESPLNDPDTKMVRCPRCGRLTPPNAMEGGACLEHQSEKIHAAYGGSPSAHAIRQLQHRNLKAEETPLPPATKSALRREIRRFKQGKWKPNVHKSNNGAQI